MHCTYISSSRNFIKCDKKTDNKSIENIDSTILGIIINEVFIINICWWNVQMIRKKFQIELNLGALKIDYYYEHILYTWIFFLKPTIYFAMIHLNMRAKSKHSIIRNNHVMCKWFNHVFFFFSVPLFLSSRTIILKGKSFKNWQFSMESVQFDDPIRVLNFSTWNVLYVFIAQFSVASKKKYRLNHTMKNNTKLYLILIIHMKWTNHEKKHICIHSFYGKK